MINGKTKRKAAIWARTSTSQQTSLPDQISRVKAKLESLGYQVPEDRILATDWTSLELFSCPKFQTLLGWVRRHEIQALGLFDRDRLAAEGMERLVFLTECKDAGVVVIPYQGPDLISGDEGQLVELALTIGKKRSVMRAREGARDGLHDKVVRDRKPISRHRVFGYTWENDRRLAPNGDWDTVKIIFDLAMKRMPTRRIARELENRGIPSPRGNSNWGQRSISAILGNPLYGGRYHGLKSRTCQPKKRMTLSYGNTSAKRLPLEESAYLPEVDVVNPPVTWGQFLKLEGIRRQNRELARRNAKRSYLLSGMVFCETHKGKKGQPLRYYGDTQGGYLYYVCQVGGCAHAKLNGKKLERDAKDFAWMLINLEPDDFYRCIANKRNKLELEDALKRELKSLESKLNRNINAETELENRNLFGQEHPEVYHRLKTRYQAERSWITERTEAINGEMAQLDRDEEAVRTLQQIREGFRDELWQLNDDQWKHLFMELGMEINVRDNDNSETWPNDRNQDKRFSIAAADRSDIEITFSLPLEPESISSIVGNQAGADAPLRRPRYANLTS